MHGRVDPCMQLACQIYPLNSKYTVYMFAMFRNETLANLIQQVKLKKICVFVPICYYLQLMTQAVRGSRLLAFFRDCKHSWGSNTWFKSLEAVLDKVFSFFSVVVDRNVGVICRHS